MDRAIMVENGLDGASSRLRLPWLRSVRWDLGFLTLSVGLVAIPYAVYLFYVLFGGGSPHDAGVKGTTAYTARVTVNYLVALLIGGPHMYATFTRTIMDRDFLRKRLAFVASSVLVPVFVVGMILYSYESYVWLLTIFFSMASIHALHQLVWVSEAYNKRSGFRMSAFSPANSFIETYSMPSRPQFGQ